MAAAILTVLLTFLIAGAAWLIAGPRFTLSEDAQVNSIRNLLAYFAATLPVVFIVVFFLVERL